MEIKTDKVDNVKVISVEGHLESSCVAAFRDKFMEETSEDTLVVLDCTNLEYLDSSGLAVLVSIFKHMGAREGKMVLCGLSNGIRKVIEFTKLDKVFNLAEDRQEAFKLLKS